MCRDKNDRRPIEAALQRKLDVAVEALKMTARKHHLGDDNIGWDELSTELCNALCETLGDTEFQEWLEGASREIGGMGDG